MFPLRRERPQPYGYSLSLSLLLDEPNESVMSCQPPLKCCALWPILHFKIFCIHKFVLKHFREIFWIIVAAFTPVPSPCESPFIPYSFQQSKTASQISRRRAENQSSLSYMDFKKTRKQNKNPPTFRSRDFGPSGESRTHGLLNPILCDGWYARKHRKKNTQTSRFPQALFPCFWYDLGGFNPHSFRLSDGPNIQWISVPRLSSLKYGFVAFSVETTALQIYASAKNGGYP